MNEQRAYLRGLRVEGFQRIKDVALEFAEDSGLICISGRNEQGKTTLIDAIWTALGGKKPKDPIHEGEHEAIIEVELELQSGGRRELLRATRRWYVSKRGGSAGDVKDTLEVVGQNGTLSSPQKVLDALLSRVALDPFAWLDLARAGLPGRRKQVAELLEGLKIEAPADLISVAAALDADPLELPTGALEQIEALEKRLAFLRDENRRQFAGPNGLVARARGVHETHPVDTAEVSARLGALREARRAQDRAEANVAALAKALQEAKRRCEKLERELATERAGMEEIESTYRACVNELTATPATNPWDIEQLEQELAQAGATNERARVWAEGQKAAQELEALEERRHELDQVADTLRASRFAALRQAGLPEGLEVGPDGGLQYRGHPFPEQASSEEQITVALAVAMATNPTLRLLRVHDGNRLDSEHRRALEHALKEHGFLALVELVDETGKVGIVIEGGEVAADNRSNT